MMKIAAAAAILMTVVSCNPANRKKALLPVISGKAGEVIVVLGKDNWEGNLGNTLRDLLTAECPYLPQKEPLYSLINVVPPAFTNIFQIHRNIIVFTINGDVTSPGVVYLQDVWARPQCVININAPDAETAAQLVEDNGKMLLNALEQAERDRIIANSKLYEEHSLAPKVRAFIGGSPHFPTGYVMKKQTNDFIWIAYETTYVNQGFLIYKYPARGNEEDFAIENIVAKRNEVLKENVPGMFENTYMTTSDITTPGLEFVKYKGREFAEVRGLWEVYNDYMGGPFVSETFYSRDGSELICMEGFVYAPKYDKRHYLRQVDSILYSFEWADEQ
ncbi:MAG: DUF4837 family protein [Bacteroidales bacterium]|nr:DUF4837 family protein [Bacteroidales bacterium]